MKILKRLFSTILCLCLFSVVLLPNYSSAATAEECDRIKQQINVTAKECLKRAERSDFDGYCAMYVNWQLVVLGVNTKYESGNANWLYDKYSKKNKTTGGYDVEAYSAGSYTLSSALNQICSNGTADVYNILVGFQTSPAGELGAKYGHALFIHAILNGNIYYSESSDVTAQGVKVRTWSIQEFANKHKKYTLDGIIHFTKPAPDHTHTPGEEWLHDETQHWHVCTGEGCSEKLDLATHAWDGGVVTTQPTETQTGVKTFTCTVCNRTKTETLPATGHITHTPDTTKWLHNETQHWHGCTEESCNEKLDAAPHTWDDGVVTTQPTETQTGVKTFTCTVCGQTKTAEIAPTGHIHAPADAWLHDETQHWHGCTVEGCDAKLDAASHVFDKSKAEIVVAPTETTHGKLAVSCEVCGYEAFGVVHHCYVEDWLHDETQHWHVCTVEGCDAKMGVAAHTWDNGVVTTQPTETQTGVKTFTCTVCKRTRTEDIPAMGTDSPSTPSTGSAIHVVTPDAPNLVEPAPLPPQTGAPMNSLAFCLLFLASAASYCFAKRMQKVS